MQRSSAAVTANVTLMVRSGKASRGQLGVLQMGDRKTK